MRAFAGVLAGGVRLFAAAFAGGIRLFAGVVRLFAAVFAGVLAGGVRLFAAVFAVGVRLFAAGFAVGVRLFAAVFASVVAGGVRPFAAAFAVALAACAPDRSSAPLASPGSSVTASAVTASSTVTAPAPTPRTVATLAWSPSLLPEPRMELALDRAGETRTSWLAPLLRVAPDGRPWLAGASGQVVRGGASWEHVEFPGARALSLAPRAGGGAVVLTGTGGGPWTLMAVDSEGRVQWQTDLPKPAEPGARLALLQDEKGQPYLFRPDRGGPVHRVDAAAGSLTFVADLQGYNAPVLVWRGAVWRIQYTEGRRLWVRRPFHGADQEISAAALLQDTMLTAIGVRSDGGPLLTDGGRLLSMSPAGETTEIALPAATQPRVLDLLRACPRPDGEVWVVAADARGATIFALGVAL